MTLYWRGVLLGVLIYLALAALIQTARYRVRQPQPRAIWRRV